MRELRLKIRSRFSRISSCGNEDFQILSRQFFSFIDSSQTLKGLVEEMIARNPKTAADVKSIPPNSRPFGNNAEEAAVVGYLVWKDVTDSSDRYALWKYTGQAKFDQSVDTFRDWYVTPFFDYVDEVLEDVSFVLSNLLSFKKKAEWFQRDRLFAFTQDEPSRLEDALARDLYEFLLDRGLEFHTEPRSASGRPDVVAVENMDSKMIADCKVFDPTSGRGAAYIKKAFYQVYHYLCDYNEPVGYLVVFNTSDKQLRLALGPDETVTPRFDFNHRTVFAVTIEINPNLGPASTRPVPESITIAADELVKECQEADTVTPT